VSKMCLDCEDAYTCIACVEKLRAEREDLLETIRELRLELGARHVKLETAREALEKIGNAVSEGEDTFALRSIARIALAAISSGEGK
jgi:uncharacterized protein involved in exopolysaccharide biosynthesis